MSTENRVTATLAEADKTAAMATAATLRAKLPFLLSLPAAEKVGFATIKERNLPFHEKCLAYMASRPDLIPAFINMPEFTKDKVLFAQLMEIYQVVAPVMRDLEDTIDQVGHEIILPEYAFYQNVKNAAKAGVPGAKAIYDDLKVRFPGHNGGTPTPPPATT